MMNYKNISFLLIALGFVAVTNNPVQAQAQNDLNQPPAFQSNEVDPFVGSSGFDPMDFIHNANFGNIRSGSEFKDDTNKQLDNATTDFKKQQQQRLMQMQQSQPSNNNTSDEVDIAN